ncbi:siderophore-interacting protein [Microbacterium sp. NPDC078428]|uniref:siderophore-interacting protein n=1 Tax=Microbacterium sp. NPDC078428 TaxID=3364190 RepID=UPI0037C62E8B
MSTSNPATAAFSLARRPLDLRFRRAALVSRERLAPHYVRVRLQGEQLRDFVSLGADDHIRVFFPAAPVETVEEMRAAPSREYTPLAWGDDWLDLEFVVHGPHGVAGVWADTAPLGSEAGVGGPRGSMVIEGRPDAWFLAGDETAIPAVRRFCAQMDEDAAGRVVLEVPGAAHEVSIEAPAGVAVEYVHRGAEAPGSALIERLDAVAAAERPAGDVFGFVAAEQSVVRSGRALLLDRWGLDAEQIVVKGYWKRDSAEYHAPH